MATTPGKMTGTEENLNPTETPAGEAGRSWSRTEGAGKGNVSNITEGRTGEGWTGQAQQGASQIADRAQDIAANVKSRAQDFASNMASKAQDVASKAQDLASNAADRTSTAIREYPMQSLLIGFGLGCLVGFLIPRR